MGHKKFYFINKLFHFLFIILFLTSCGSFQYSGYYNDGIYQNDVPSQNYYLADSQRANNKENNDFYKSAFNEKALMYSDNESNGQLFTDVENYSTSENDTINQTYGPWGDYKDSVTVNIHSYYHDGFWSRWRYPNWMWNYGYGYGGLSTWGYGYNNYWSRPFPYFGGMYDPFNPFWGYYDSFYYGYGYGYGYNLWLRPNNYWYNYYPYGRNQYNNISFINGRRGSRNLMSSRSNNFTNSNISDRFNRSSSSSLSDRLSRIDRINNSARVNPNMYNKPFNSAGSSNTLSKPVNSNTNSSKPRSNYSRQNNNYSKPDNSNYSKPGNNSYRPSNSNYSKPSYSRPSYSPSSNSSMSRPGGRTSSGSGFSRGGKSGR